MVDAESGRTIFLSVLGDTPINRVIDFLILHQEFDYSMTDIAKFAGVGYSTLKLFWDKLEYSNLIVNTRVVGKAKMFRLNMDNPVVKELVNFYWALTKSVTDEQLSEKVLAK